MQNITATCTTCAKQFLILEREQKFLQDKNLPLPSHCPSCRQLRRLKLRGERALYKINCQKCGKEIVVSYNPQTVKNPVYCREDYEKYFAENDPIITDVLPEV